MNNEKQWKEWDVFICHASEDKDGIVRPLARALVEEGLRVWYDEFTLTLGDHLRRSIDKGLALSRYGVVVLSPNFFAKEWPQTELDGLTARERDGVKVILPVWHNVDEPYVRRFSPTLAGRVAVSTQRGLEIVVREILNVVRLPEVRNPAKTTARAPEHDRNSEVERISSSQHIGKMPRSPPVPTIERPERGKIERERAARMSLGEYMNRLEDWFTYEEEQKEQRKMAETHHRTATKFFLDLKGFANAFIADSSDVKAAHHNRLFSCARELQQAGILIYTPTPDQLPENEKILAKRIVSKYI